MKWIAAMLLCALTVLVCPVTYAQGSNELQAKLRQTIGGKLLALRIPYAGTVLKYDALGVLQNKSEVRPWTSKGVLRVKDLILTDHSLEIEGERVLLARDTSKDDGFLPIATNQKLRIMIELGPPLSEEQINKTLLTVFIPDDLKSRFSEYWKPKVVSKPSQPQVGKNKIVKIVGELDGRDVCGASAGLVEAPRAMDTPEPKFPQGLKPPKDHVEVLYVVINEAGFPAIVQVMKSIGEQFDIAALYAVSEWRFHPALKGSDPVAVAINVRVDFRQ